LTDSERSDGLPTVTSSFEKSSLVTGVLNDSPYCTFTVCSGFIT